MMQKGVLNMNKDCEHTNINLVKNRIHNFENKSDLDVLSNATLEIFEKEKAPSLVSFYKCRFVSDVSKRSISPKKEQSVK